MGRIIGTSALAFLLGLLLAGCGKGDGSPVQVTVAKVENDRVTLKYVNNAAQDITGGYIKMYCYGADDKQSGSESITLGISVKKGDSKEDTLPVRCAAGAKTVEAQWYYINYADKTKWDNPAQPPDQRPKGGKT